MKRLPRQLKTISKSLATLSKQVEKIAEQIENLQPASKMAATGRSGVRAAGMRTDVTARGKSVLDTVFDVIKRSRKGVTIPQLKEKTSLDARQLSNALYKLSKKGQIFAKSRGQYVKK